MSCREEFPHLEAIYQKYRPLGLAMVAVDTRDDREGTQEFYQQYGFEIPAAFDTVGVASQFGIMGTPTTYLLDEQGRIIWRHYGYVAGEEDALEEKIAELLTGRP